MRLTMPPTGYSLSLPNRRQPKVPKHSKQLAGWNGCAARTASEARVRRNRQFGTDLQLSRTRSSAAVCGLTPGSFRAKSCSIGLTSSRFAQQIQPAGKFPVPLILSFTCVQSHRKVIICALMQLAFIPLTTHSRSEDSVFAVNISRHIDKKRSCDGLKMPYPP